MASAPLVVHVGYPKTATTTFQRHVFAKHPDIDYLGKYIPSFRYRDDELYPLIDALVHRSTLSYEGPERLRDLITSARETSRKVVLLSSESFVHPSAIDIAMIADRVHAAFSPCKILITIREQISAILSFYWMHGRYGQYLSIGPKEESRRLSYPFGFGEWIQLQKSAECKNFLTTLHYDRVISYYASRFGQDNIAVLLYERLRKDQLGYVKQLGAFLGVDGQTMAKLIAGKHELRSSELIQPWDGAAAGYLLEMERRGILGKALYRLTRHSITHSGRRKDVEEILNELRLDYMRGNSELSRSLGLPLREHGYSL